VYPISPHIRSNAHWWDTNKSSSTRTIKYGLDVNLKTTTIVDQFGNNKKSLDHQGECSID
jgi:hypothetical protein